MLGVLEVAVAFIVAEDTITSVPVAAIMAVPTTIGAVGGVLAAFWARSAKHELKENGGGSTKDAVLRVDSQFGGAVERFTDALSQVNGRLDAFDERLQKVEHHVSSPVQLVQPVVAVEPVTSAHPTVAVEPVTAHPKESAA